jgi:histidine ammonia-lyase
MSAGLAIRLWETLPRMAEVLAIEIAYAAQARAVREAIGSIPTKAEGHAADKVLFGHGDWRLSPATEAVVERVWEVFPKLEEDTVLSDRLQELARVVTSGELVRIASERLAEDVSGPCFPDPSVGKVEEGDEH